MLKRVTTRLSKQPKGEPNRLANQWYFDCDRADELEPWLGLHLSGMPENIAGGGHPDLAAVSCGSDML